MVKNNGFILVTTMTPASVHDTNYFLYLVIASCHTKDPMEQYFGLRHLYDGAYRGKSTTIMKNIWDSMCRQMAFNMFRGSKSLADT
jgi:hypothetical protein